MNTTLAGKDAQGYYVLIMVKPAYYPMCKLVNVVIISDHNGPLIINKGGVKIWVHVITLGTCTQVALINRDVVLL